MKLSKRVWPICLLPLLAGCDLLDSKSVKQIIETCKYESHLAFANSPLVGGPRLSAIEQLTNACLKKNGLRESAESETAQKLCTAFPQAEQNSPIGASYYRLNVEVCWTK